jgi:hypothetical protein
MIVAGASFPLTGRYALQGRRAFRGLQLWAAWASDQGDLPVSLRVSDDRSRIADARRQVGRRPVLVERRDGRKTAAWSPAEKEASCLSPTFDD